MAGKKLTESVGEMLADFLTENGYELYHVEYVKEGKDRVLRVFVDFVETPAGRAGIGTDDCEKVSRFLGARLDERDLIPQNYYLEVSSPGLDRELLSDAHFEKYAGRRVEISLYKALEGRKTIRGTLLGLDGDDIAVEADGKLVKLPRASAAKTRLEVII